MSLHLAEATSGLGATVAAANCSLGAGPGLASATVIVTTAIVGGITADAIFALFACAAGERAVRPTTAVNSVVKRLVFMYSLS
jgi:hypothetical protein